MCVAPLKSGPWTLYISKIATDNGDDDDVDDEDLWYVHEYVCVFYDLSSSCVYIFAVLSVKSTACFLIRAFYIYMHDIYIVWYHHNK